MELYFAYPSPYSQKVLIALYEKRLDFVAKHVDLGDPKDHEEYREIYPLGKVPLLVTDDNQFVPESSVIVEYLDEIAETPRMVSSVPSEARIIRMWDRLIDQNLTGPVISLLFESMKPEAQRDQAALQKWSRSVGTMYRMMNDQLAKSAYLGGMNFSLADCAAMPALNYSNQFASLSGFEHLSTYFETIKTRPAITTVFEDATPYINALLQR